LIKKIALLSTATGVANLMKDYISEHIPQIQVFNIIDEGVLQELIRVGTITPKINRRICQNIIAAEEYGAEAVLLTCSSISPCINIAQKLVGINIYRIDEAMAEKAVILGSNIGVVATINSTLAPTCELIKEKAAAINKDINIKTVLCTDAFQAFLRGDAKTCEKLIKVYCTKQDPA